jgi:hypothetical protein
LRHLARVFITAQGTTRDRSSYSGEVGIGRIICWPPDIREDNVDLVFDSADNIYGVLLPDFDFTGDVEAQAANEP